MFSMIFGMELDEVAIESLECRETRLAAFGEAETAVAGRFGGVFVLGKV